jgi:hypothetical protein
VNTAVNNVNAAVRNVGGFSSSLDAGPIPDAPTPQADAGDGGGKNPITVNVSAGGAGFSDKPHRPSPDVSGGINANIGNWSASVAAEVSRGYFDANASASHPAGPHSGSVTGSFDRNFNLGSGYHADVLGAQYSMQFSQSKGSKFWGITDLTAQPNVSVNFERDVNAEPNPNGTGPNIRTVTMFPQMTLGAIMSCSVSNYAYQLTVNTTNSLPQLIKTPPWWYVDQTVTHGPWTARATYSHYSPEDTPADRPGTSLRFSLMHTVPDKWTSAVAGKLQSWLKLPNSKSDQ